MVGPGRAGKRLRFGQHLETHRPGQRRDFDEADFDAVMGHLGDTLAERGVPAPLIAEAAAIALSVKTEVLNR